MKTLLLCASLACAGEAARAAHPLQTEDTGTQGAGNLELENGLQRSLASGGAHVYSYQPQVSYGLTPSLDGIVQPAWLSLRDEGGGGSARGWGDTNVDAKWRFFGSAPLSLAVRAGLAIPTSEHGLGNPHGKLAAHALLVATWDAAPFTWHANLGLTRNPQDPRSPSDRRGIAGASAAIMWATSEQLTLTLDGGAEQDADPARKTWPSRLLAGAIYTLRPGLDADIGWQSSLQAAERSRELLIGLTWRFAP